MEAPRILVLEDSRHDAELIQLQLESLPHVFHSVETRDQFLSALSEFRPDIILSDYRLPSFGGIEALALAREICPEIPFILVTGALGEEVAVDMLKKGVTDYILKHRLVQLAPSVQRALRESRERQELKETARELKESEALFRQLTGSIREVFWMTDSSKHTLVFVSPGYEAIWGRTCESLYQSPLNWLEAIHPEDRERVRQAALTKQVSGQYHEEYRIVRPDGSIRWIQDRAFPVQEADGSVVRIAGLAADITEQKLSEQRLATEHAVFRALTEATNVEEGALGVLQALCECLGWQLGILWRLNGSDQTLYCVNLWHSAERFREFAAQCMASSFRMNEGFLGHVWSLGRPVLIPDLLAPAEFQFPRAQAAGQCGLRSVFAIPIILRGRMLGVMEFFSGEIRQPNALTTNMINALGTQMGEFMARKDSEQALRRAEMNFRSIFENARDGIFQTTREGSYLNANPALAQMLGYESPQVLMASIRNVGEQLCVDRTTRARLTRQLDQEGFVKGFENEVYRKDGKAIWVSINAHAVRDADGRLLYYEGTCQDITQRKEAEIQLATLAHAVESTAELICITDLQDRFTFVNHAFQKAYGYTAAEIVGKTPEILFSPNNSPGLIRDILEKTRAGGWQGEVLDLRKDGTEIPVHLSTSAIQNTRGQTIGLMGVARDISEHKKAEKQIRLLADAVQSTQEFISITDTSNCFTFVNRAFLEAYGYTEAEVLGKTPNFLYAAENPPDLCERIHQETLKGGWNGEVKNRTKHGQEFPVQLSTSQIKDAQGRVIGLIGVARDISERTRAAEDLRIAENKYRAIFENASDGIFQATLDGRIVNANPAMAQMFGFDSIEQFISSRVTPDQTFVFQEDRLRLRGLLQTQGFAKNFEAQRYRKDGSRFWVSINAHVVRDASGKALYCEGTDHDITEQKRAEVVLRESERRLRLIAENTTDVIFAFDMARRPLYANPAVEGLTGYTFAEIQERGFINWIHPEDEARMLALWEELYLGKSYSDVEFRLVTKSGRIKYCSSTWGPLFDETGRQVGVQGREQDISQRKQLEQQVLESTVNERRRIGHELHDGLGQYLTGISFRIKALEHALRAVNPAAAEDANDLARLVSKAIAQARSLARGLDPVDVETKGLPAALENLAAETNDFFGVHVLISYTGNLATSADAGLALYRISQEAIHNAVRHGEATRVELCLEGSDDYLLLKVHDHGIGFDASLPQSGGMGLRVMEYRARSIGGELKITSRKGEGTEIRCLLPRRLKKAETQPTTDLIMNHTER